MGYKTYRLPLPTPLRTAHGCWNVREGIIVRLEDEIGRVGYGEVAPIPWFGTESLEEADRICRELGDSVTDEILDAVPQRFGCVRFALAAARDRGASPFPERRLPVAALLPPGRAGLKKLPKKLAAGFLAFKWKVGVGEVNSEIAMMDDLLAMMPASGRLRLDANGAWSHRLAARWCERCVGRPIEFIEQPIPPADEDGLRGLAKEYPVPIALDESTVHLQDMQRWHSRGWTGIYVVKPSLAGPLDELQRVVDELSLDVVLSSAIETTIGLRAVLAEALRGRLTKRALGAGRGEIFGQRVFDGPPLGPFLDEAWLVSANPEGVWNALN
ncbi:MAG: o-succinylbenzoate synthase [Opitutaceae bacterium]|nr:o-succinylbenzoate synthase [Opitutaceae bacterium]